MRMQCINSCAICHKSFAKPCLLRRHEVVHTAAKPYECTKCQKSFSQKSSLRRHELNHSGASAKKNKCAQCPMSFAQKVNLSAHIKRSHPSKLCADKPSYACSQCSCLFKKLNTLNRHVRAQHPPEQDILDDNTPLDDPDALAKRVLKQLKSLQNIMTPTATMNEATKSESLQQPAIINVPPAKVLQLADRLNPQAATQYIEVQCIRREDEQSYYVCEFCAKEFRKAYNFIRHRRTHTNERPYKCLYCVQQFKTKTSLHKHTNLHKVDAQLGLISKQHKCSICNRCYGSIRQLDKHMSAHASTHIMKYNCASCQATFSTKSALSLHKHRVEDKEFNMLKALIPEPINLTEKSNDLKANPNEDSTTALKPQTKSISKQKFKCDLCKRLLCSKSSLNAHQRIHHNMQNYCYACAQCAQRKFSTHAALQRHLLTHSTIKRNFKCVYCIKTFKTKQTCRAHMSLHIKRLLNDQNSYSKQPAYINTKPQEYHVIVTERRDDAESKTPSSVMPKFIELQMLAKCTQHKHRNFKIESLEKSTQLLESIEQPAKNSCAICVKAFRKPSDLKRHLATHATERAKPFDCINCGKRFALKSTLQEHLLTHQVERRKFDCIVCGKQYASKKVLVIHERLHTGVRPFQCEHCEKTFRTSGHRISHVKAAHAAQS